MIDILIMLLLALFIAIMIVDILIIIALSKFGGNENGIGCDRTDDSGGDSDVENL